MDVTLTEAGPLTVSCEASNDGTTNHQWSNADNFRLVSLTALGGTPAAFNEASAYIYANIDGHQVALGRGATWGTQATLDNDKARTVSLTGQPVVTVQFEQNKDLFATGDNWVYTDNTSNSGFFFIPQTDGGYKIYLASDISKAIAYTTVETKKDKNQDREVPPTDKNATGDVLHRVVLQVVDAAQAATFYVGTAKAVLQSRAQTYGTFYAPFAVSLPSGVTAYTCAGLVENTNQLALTEVGQSVAADQAVILQSSKTDDAEETYYGTPVENLTKTTGLLTGVTEPTSVENGKFVMQRHDNVVGFYEVQSQDVTLGANRCYLTAPAGSNGVKGFVLDAATGILEMQNAECKMQNGVAYDLAGRRVTRAAKGLYIINGKKVIR